METRQSTGIPGLDAIFLGGLIPRRSYLISGSAGTGKTILSIQWLLKGRALGENCLYISLIERQDDIESNIHNFGWSLENIEVVELIKMNSDQEEAFEEYHIFPPDEIELSEIWADIYKHVKEKKPDRLVIDCASQLRFLSTDTFQFRKRIFGLLKFLNKRNVTTLMIFDPLEIESDSSVTLAVDGVIRMRMQESPGFLTGLRYIEIEKMRGSDFLSGYHPFRITNSGIHIYPHKIEKKNNNKKILKSKDLIGSGIQHLDEMLCGGLQEGTTTIISGGTGIGKSTLATQYLVHSAEQGLQGLIIMFEESEEFLTYRCRQLGMPIDQLLKDNMIKLIKINPIEYYPDELLLLVRYQIKKWNVKVVMIDSVHSYIFAMKEFGENTVISHLHNLLSYLKRKYITTFLVNEVESIAGDLSVTEYGLSHFGDNIIILRFAERLGEILKIIVCLKTRLGNFQSESRVFNITKNGITVSEKVQIVRGLLSTTVSHE